VTFPIALPVGTFAGKYATAVAANDSLLCIGLDVDPAKLPAPLRALPVAEAMRTFCREIIAATSDCVCAYKPNLAFFLAQGAAGFAVLCELREMIPAHIPLLLDAKFNDIGNTAEMYAATAYDVIGADAVTVNPYMGEDATMPFLARSERTAFVLVKTSNPGSGDVQDVRTAGGNTVAHHIAAHVREWGAAHGNAGVVVGATYPAELAAVRAILPDAPILVPGIGAQGGDIAATVRAGRDAHDGGLLISASRSVLYASAGDDFAEAARAESLRLRDAINEHRPPAS